MLHKITTCNLAPWQKLDAIRTFVQPKLSYLSRTNVIAIEDLKALDKILVKCIKRITHLPINASIGYLFANARAGGLGMCSFTDDYESQTITHAFRLLTSRNNTTRKMAGKQLREEVNRWIHNDPTDQEISQICNAKTDG